MFDAKLGAEQVRHQQAVREPPGGCMAGEVPAIGDVVAPHECWDEHVVAGVQRRVAKEEDGRKFGVIGAGAIGSGCGDGEDEEEEQEEGR